MYILYLRNLGKITSVKYSGELVQLFENLITILDLFNNKGLSARGKKLYHTLSSVSYSHTLLANVIVNGSSYKPSS